MTQNIEIFQAGLQGAYKPGLMNRFATRCGKPA
jgi:hypothetical protein